MGTVRVVYLLAAVHSPTVHHGEPKGSSGGSKVAGAMIEAENHSRSSGEKPCSERAIQYIPNLSNFNGAEVAEMFNHTVYTEAIATESPFCYASFHHHEHGSRNTTELADGCCCHMGLEAAEKCYNLDHK